MIRCGVCGTSPKYEYIKSRSLFARPFLIFTSERGNSPKGSTTKFSSFHTIHSILSQHLEHPSAHFGRATSGPEIDNSTAQAGRDHQNLLEKPRETKKPCDLLGDCIWSPKLLYILSLCVQSVIAKEATRMSISVEVLCRTPSLADQMQDTQSSQTLLECFPSALSAMPKYWWGSLDLGPTSFNIPKGNIVIFSTAQI